MADLNNYITVSITLGPSFAIQSCIACSLTNQLILVFPTVNSVTATNP